MSDAENSTNTEASTVQSCPICGKSPCECNEFTCPRHGRVKAKLTGKTSRKITRLDPSNPGKVKEISVEYDDYCCSIEGCNVHRIIPEMEYPHRNE